MRFSQILKTQELKIFYQKYYKELKGTVALSASVPLFIKAVKSEEVIENSYGGNSCGIS